MSDKKTIILIDEDPAICLAFKKVLNANYRIIASNNFADGLFALKMNKPMLVIIDIKIPGDIEKIFIQQIKNFQSSLPIFIITAFSNYFNYDDIKSFGADDYLKKPFDIDDLLQKLKKIENRGNEAA